MSSLVAPGIDTSTLPPGAIDAGPTTTTVNQNGTQSVAPQAPIVTSGASRVQTASNVAKLSTANASITPPVTTPATSTGGNSSSTPSVVINNGGGSSTPTSTTTTPPANSGINGANSVGTQGSWQTDPSSGVEEFVPAGGQPSWSSSSTTDTDGSGEDPTAGLDLPPALKSQYQSSIDSLNSELTQQQANITALTATLNNDPAAQAAAQSIMDKYNVLIQAMTDKNTQLLGRARSAVGAFGGLGSMSQTFMSNEMDEASSRIADLVSQEQDLIIKSNQAYKDGDLKALNDAQTEYDKVNSDKTTALRDLLTATNNQVKNVQAQQKIDNAATTAQINNDIKNSNGVAATIAAQLTKNGVTDLSTYDFTDMAQQLGISDPATLSAAVVKAGQTNQKAADVSANTADTIANRDQRTAIAATKKTASTAAKGGTDGSFTYTGDDLAQYSNLLNQGGVAPDGTKYAARGTDGYVDPGAYNAAYSDWIANGGTPAGFAKKFPVKTNVNPASYTSLPAAIQPKPTNTAAPYSTT